MSVNFLINLALQNRLRFCYSYLKQNLRGVFATSSAATWSTRAVRCAVPEFPAHDHLVPARAHLRRIQTSARKGV